MVEAVSKVRRAVLYTCKEYGIPSRCNHLLEHPRDIYEGDGNNSLLQALTEFAASRERCALVLELENGREITLCPTLHDDYPAFGERGYDPRAPVKWDATVEVWPPA